MHVYEFPNYKSFETFYHLACHLSLLCFSIFDRSLCEVTPDILFWCVRVSVILAARIIRLY